MLWLGQVCTSMGQWMDQVTRGWLMYELTGSAADLGFVTAARGLPLLFFGVIAGALADRSGRKVQLVVAQVTNAALNHEVSCGGGLPSRSTRGSIDGLPSRQRRLGGS